MEEQMKVFVFKMNDYDWWADYDVESAIQNYTSYQIEVAGVPLSDIEVTAARKLTEEEMDRVYFRDHDAEEKWSMREELEYRITRGEKFPQFFASTEY